MQDPKTAHLTIEGATYELPILPSSCGRDVIDISPLANSKYFAFDPGFTVTAPCASDITYIDGQEGALYYRGYAIDVLAAKADYIEVCHALLFGDLPTATQKERFLTRIVRNMPVHDQLRRFFGGFRRDAHPMAVMAGVVGALSSFYHNELDISNPDARDETALHVIAKLPTLAAMSYKYSIGEPFMYPRNDFGYAENFLYMMFATPADKDYRVNPVWIRAMDKMFTLHADHEQNASTATVRLAGSTGANPYGCIAAGIVALWGPRHGGANEAVLRMLDEIGDIDQIDVFIQKVKDKEAKLMGFGHRVYKNFDPRAQVLKETCDEVLEALGVDDPKLKLAMALEKRALEDEYFVSRNLYPNVDFYSGIILKALGIPTSMFTVIFVIARAVGWISHWRELHCTGARIGRPRQRYTGHLPRDFVAIEDREEG